MTQVQDRALPYLAFTDLDSLAYVLHLTHLKHFLQVDQVVFPAGAKDCNVIMIGVTEFLQLSQDPVDQPLEGSRGIIFSFFPNFINFIKSMVA